MTVANVKKQHLLQVLKLIVYQITMQRTKLVKISPIQDFRDGVLILVFTRVLFFQYLAVLCT